MAKRHRHHLRWLCVAVARQNDKIHANARSTSGPGVFTGEVDIRVDVPNTGTGAERLLETGTRPSNVCAASYPPGPGLLPSPVHHTQHINCITHRTIQNRGRKQRDAPPFESRRDFPNEYADAVGLRELLCLPTDWSSAYAGPGVSLLRYFSYTDCRMLVQISIAGGARARAARTKKAVVKGS